jgi:hypothetical protein
MTDPGKPDAGQSATRQSTRGSVRSAAAAKPPTREPETEGLRDEKPGIAGPHRGNDSRQAPANPKTAGAPGRPDDPLPDPFARRRSDAPDQDGATPRPDENPVE